MMSTLPTEVINTGKQPDSAVIWLHGLGADGHDFVPIVNELNLPATYQIRFVFPHAPVRPVTLNNGHEMRAWFDMFSLDRADNAKEEDILTSVSWIQALIDQEVANGIQPERIVLAGFSQGGVVALHTGLRYPQRLAGIMALSTYLPYASHLLKQFNPEQTGLPIFAAHGKFDPVIPIQSWEHYVPLLKEHGFMVEAHQYPMEHSVSVEEISDISHWLQQVLKP